MTASRLKADEVCLIFEGNDKETVSLTWAEVHEQVCRFANALKVSAQLSGAFQRNQRDDIMVD